jgi:cobalt-zinc-cadmium efflux system protein
MTHNSHPRHSPALARRVMGVALGITLALVLVEAIAGYFANSLALLSDAGHNFADAAALGLSWYALWIAKKPSHQGMTFGYHRVGILAALINSASLVVIALLIFWEALQRLRQPEPVQSGLMIAVAAAAVVLNGLIGFWLHPAAKHDLNVRSAYLHMLGDAVAALGVVIAGIFVIATGSAAADPIVSCLIAALILFSSWGILKESVLVLLEGAPVGIDMALVEKTVASVEGVLNVHDLHVWTVGPGAVACSCHILVAEQTIREGQQILKAVIEELHLQFGINHTTVQVEVEGHGANDMYCCIEPHHQDEHAGHRH